MDCALKNVVLVLHGNEQGPRLQSTTGPINSLFHKLPCIVAVCLHRNNLLHKHYMPLHGHKW